MQRQWRRAGLHAVTIFVPASGVNAVKDLERDLAAPICASKNIKINPGDVRPNIRIEESDDENRLMILACRYAAEGVTAFEDRGVTYMVSDFI